MVDGIGIPRVMWAAPSGSKVAESDWGGLGWAGLAWAKAEEAKVRTMVADRRGEARRFMHTVEKEKEAPEERRWGLKWGYAKVYLPRSIVFCAICRRRAMVLNGSCLDSLRTMASWVRSISPSATSAMTFLAAASIFSNAWVR